MQKLSIIPDTPPEQPNTQEEIVGIINPGEMVQKLMNMDGEEILIELAKITKDQVRLLCQIALRVEVNLKDKNGGIYQTKTLPGQGLRIFEDQMARNPVQTLINITEHHRRGQRTHELISRSPRHKERMAKFKI